MPPSWDPSDRPAARVVAGLRAFARDDSGQDLIEYAFLAAFVATAGYVALNDIVPAVRSAYASWIDPDVGAPSLWDPSPR